MPYPSAAVATVRKTEEPAHVALVLRQLRLIKAILGLQVGFNLRRQLALAAERAALCDLHHDERHGEHHENEWSHHKQPSESKSEHGYFVSGFQLVSIQTYLNCWRSSRFSPSPRTNGFLNSEFTQ